MIPDPKTYPVDEYLPRVLNELETSSSLIIGAETGAGKTTRIPPYLALKRKGKVLVLEPRRLAAKLSAERCAQALNSKVGDLVGHHIRFDRRISENTKLIFITEGLFLSYLRQSPSLEGFDTVIIDEFHERNIHTDVALALCKRLQATNRKDLKLIVMSATLNIDFLKNYLHDARSLSISGRTFPVQIEYRDIGQKRMAWDDFAIKSALEILNDPRNPLNTLVFLPGVGEIKTLEQKLSSLTDVEVCPLYSSQQKKDQEKAFKGKNRKIVLATNIAETSLTLPNITGVVDLGKERRASFAPWSGMPLLELKDVSQASATQRAGRAGRTQEGVVYRLYSQENFTQREAFTPPEVKRVELSHYVLDLLDLGVPIETLEWPEAPEERNLMGAMELLDLLGAVSDNHLSDRGRFMARTPLHPRYGAMIFNNQKNTDLLLAVSILSEGGILSKQAHFGTDDNESCDVTIQINLMKDFLTNSKSRFSDYHHSFLEKKKAIRVKELYSSLVARFGLNNSASFSETDQAIVQKALLAGFPDRLAKKRTFKKGKKNQISYNLCLGRGGTINNSSALYHSMPEYIIALEALEDPKANAAIGTSIRMGSGLRKEIVLESSASLLKEGSETYFNEKKGLIKVTKTTHYGKLLLNEEELPAIRPEGKALIKLMLNNWPWPFSNDDELKFYHRRLKVLEKSGAEHACPYLIDDMFEIFLAAISEELSFEQLKSADLKKLIEDQLSPQDLYVLNEKAPQEIKLENGKIFNVFYSEDGPVIQARVQDLYGTNIHPKLAESSPVKVELLTPAQRLAQVTMDLPSFWCSSWEQVRKELKARYPKHFWPEDPVNAPPTRMKKDLKT